MPLIIVYLLLLFTPIKKQTSQWTQLKEAAHQIGFCVYNINEMYCEEHKDEFAKRAQLVNLEEEDVYYFEMKEDWAKERIEGRAELDQRPKENYLILFDIQQGSFASSKDSSFSAFSCNKFLIVNLDDAFTFTQKAKTNVITECLIESEGRHGIMENTLWREFMTNRLGRFSDKVSLWFINQNSKAYFNKFKQAFTSYQTTIKN